MKIADLDALSVRMPITQYVTTDSEEWKKHGMEIQ